MSRKLFLVTFVVIAIVTAAIPHFRMAFTIGTGIGLSGLQNRIDKVQLKAINNKNVQTDRVFLQRLYRTMAYGAQITFVLPESSRLMHHYLNGSGKTESIDPSLYTKSPRVINQMKTIKRKLTRSCEVGSSASSKRFDMGHGYPLDAHFALYFGTISGQVESAGSKKYIKWLADMPWKWPTNADIKKTYGTYQKEIFPFPNLLSFAGLGPKMWLPNALGGELEKQGLAKAFDIITTWQETIDC